MSYTCFCRFSYFCCRQIFLLFVFEALSTFDLELKNYRRFRSSLNLAEANQNSRSTYVTGFPYFNRLFWRLKWSKFRLKFFLGRRIFRRWTGQPGGHHAHCIETNGHGCAACTPDEVNKCVDQAKRAQKSWAKVPLWKRAEMLHAFAKILRDNKDPIAKCLTDEVGKCLKDAVVEVIHSLLRH